MSKPDKPDEGELKGSLKDLHDKGERDCSEGKCEPPHGVVGTFLATFTGDYNRAEAEDQAYNKGWQNAHRQK